VWGKQVVGAEGYGSEFAKADADARIAIVLKIDMYRLTL
jgi:hypothetical protein